MNVLVNVIAFKVGWASTIFGAANGMPFLGPVIVVAVVMLHLIRADRPAEEFQLLLWAGLIGGCWDSALVAAGWLEYANGEFVSGLAPYWIVAMWILFATTLNLTFRWLRSRLALAAVMGAVFGPLSYFVGSSLGAVQIVNLPAAMIALSIAWAILMPALIVLASRYDGYPAQSAAPTAQGA